MATMTIDRVIDWAQCQGMGVDACFRTGKVTLTGAKTYRFKSADEALAWMQGFSKNWGLTQP